jgi:site-specific DNA recombinase
MTADLYIRVSTDEQADKGYSQRDQDDRLRKYCDANQIKVRNVIYEDHSAKSFNRPQWNNLLLDLKKHRGQVNVILFLKWDRFSRNAGDAYQMISTLRKLGVEPQAIEQPLDLAIPENKLMLAFYLAAPEVENDRRALNVTYGMKKARKEGRWMGKAPLGYANKITEDGKKYIAPKEPGASILKWAFHTIANGQYQVEQIHKEVNKKGFTVCKSGFWNILRNPVYCGKILTNGWKELHKTYVPGQHEPIISETLYNDVQDFLDGKKKNYRTKVGCLEILQLRGFIKCPKCDKLLTGSASRGHGGLYYYYHCSSSCGTRFKSQHANELFAGELKKYIPRPGMEDVFKLVINEVYLAKTRNQKEEIKTIKAELEQLNSRLSKARELLLSGDLDGSDYKQIKSEAERKIAYLEGKASDLSKGCVSIEPLLDKALNSLTRLDKLYTEADTKRKREIISSMYPEKLTFDGMCYRTSRLNEAVELIYKLGEDFSQNEKGQISKKTNLSSLVGLLGFEPRRTESKSVVLPLHYNPIGKIGCKNKEYATSTQIDL